LAVQPFSAMILAEAVFLRLIESPFFRLIEPEVGVVDALEGAGAAGVVESVVFLPVRLLRNPMENTFQILLVDVRTRNWARYKMT